MQSGGRNLGAARPVGVRRPVVEQRLDTTLRGFQSPAPFTGQPHAELEGGERLFEGQLAFLEPTDEEAPEPTADEASGALVDEANAVLVALGWRPKPVEKALAAVIDSDAWKASPGSLDELVRRALAELMER